MLKGIVTAAAAGVVVTLLGAVPVQADDDTMRLGGNIDSKATTLSYDGQSETTLMSRGVRGFVGGHYGYRPYHGYAYHRPFYGAAYYRPFYSAAHYRPYYNVGYYGGGYYGGGAYYGGAYYGGAYSPYYGTSVIYTSPYYYNNCAPVYYGVASGSYYPVADVQTGPVRQGIAIQAPQQLQYTPAVPMAPADGTYRYDGGPASPIPLPKGVQQPNAVPPDGRLVNLPAQQKVQSGPSFAYPAYGDFGPASTFATGRPAGK